MPPRRLCLRLFRRAEVCNDAQKMLALLLCPTRSKQSHSVLVTVLIAVLILYIRTRASTKGG
jgi:hypothetical protein